MIYTLGDSHAMTTFAGIAGVGTRTVGAVTLKRAGIDPTLLTWAVHCLCAKEEDAVILCFGEIDVRCHVKPALDHRKVSLTALLASWVAPYLDVARASRAGRVAIMSVVPPVTTDRAFNATLPVGGSDGERVLYTYSINDLLRSGCIHRGLRYLDVHSEYRGEDGMLREEISDGGVHIKDTARAAALLRREGLL